MTARDSTEVCYKSEANVQKTINGTATAAAAAAARFILAFFSTRGVRTIPVKSLCFTAAYRRQMCLDVLA